MKKCAMPGLWFLGVLFWGLGLIWFSAISLADSAPMVEKHIFLPEKPIETKETISDDKLEKSILFTGVIISDKGRFALVKERARKNPAELQKRIYQEGETISGAVISSISPNQMVLTNAGKNIKIKLYSADKQRPAPVTVQAPVALTPEPAPAGGTQSGEADKEPDKDQAAATVSQSPAQLLDNKIRQSEAAKGNVMDKQSNPFVDALKKAIENKNAAAPTGGSGTGGSTNPFLEAIKRAQEKQ